MHLPLRGVGGTEHVPFYYGDDGDEGYYVGCFPAVEAVGHAFEDELGDERERHVESCRRRFEGMT